MKVILTVEGIDDSGEKFQCPLPISEDTLDEEALNIFRNAIVVFRHALAAREGREMVNCGRFAGRMKPEEAALYHETRMSLVRAGKI